ncbi:hypothetical protein FlaCF_0475 [Flavobacterium tructae]
MLRCLFFIYLASINLKKYYKKLIYWRIYAVGSVCFANNSVKSTPKKALTNKKANELAFISYSRTVDGTTYTVSCVCNSHECSVKLQKAIDAQ